MDHPAFAFAASALTWLSLHDVDLPDAELARLARLSPAEIGGLRLTDGQPPLHLREVQLPPIVQGLRPGMLPVLVQADMQAPGFGPWALLLAVDAAEARLADPIAGEVSVPVQALEDHLAGVVALYRDPAGLTGLGPGDAGEPVRALQERLLRGGFLEQPPNGVFDDATAAALARFRARRGLPAGPRVDSLAALALLSETAP